MLVLASTAGEVAYYGLAVFLVAIGLGTAYMLFKLGQTFGRLSSFLAGTERDLLPVIVKTGGTVDRINHQLDKADVVTDSAVSIAESTDTAVRAVSYAITTPVEKVSAFAAGVAHGVGSLKKKRDPGEAMRAARAAAAQREHDLHEDLATAERQPPAAPRGPTVAEREPPAAEGEPPAAA
jgi:hypothetical protein